MHKKILLLVFFGIFFSCFSVFATTNFTSPVTDGNYSGTFNITLNTNVTHATNATCYYDSSGGAATTFLAEILNDTSSDVLFDNGSISLNGFSETANYNISCTVYGDINETVSLSGITIDNTAPSVNASNIYGVSYSTQSRVNGTFVLNVSVSDSINATTVFFNLTNSSGSQNAIYYAAREGTSNNWVNLTGFNISKFTQGAYTINVYASDLLDNLNSTESSGTIYLDSTSPSLITLALSSRGASSLNLDIAIADNTGIPGSCSVSGGDGGASISGTGLAQTLTETGLGCSHGYSYVVTCIDMAGNSNSSDSTLFTTANCAASSGGSSSSTTAQWTNTYLVQDSQFETGYSRELSSKQRMKVSLGAESHYVGVKNLTLTSAVIEISSDPIEAIFNIGEEKKFDVSSDGFYDLQVKLIEINNNKANVSVIKIHETVSAQNNSQDTTGLEDGATETGNDSTEKGSTSSQDKSRNLAWVWWLIGIVILVGLGIGGWFVYKNYKDNTVKGKKKK